MFTAENFYSDEVFYDYHALNQILFTCLAKSGSTDEDESKLRSMIGSAIEERDGVLYYESVVVGSILDALDDA